MTIGRKRILMRLLSFLLTAAVLLTSLTMQIFFDAVPVSSIGTVTNPEERSYEEFGDWAHYGSIIFDTMTAYQADTEAPMAVGKRIHMYDSGNGYDIGDAITISNAKIGFYTNENNYPSLLFGGDGGIRTDKSSGPENSFYFGSSPQSNPDSAPSSFYNVYGGSITMTEEMHERNASLKSGGALSSVSTGGVFAGGYDKADSEELSKWFDYWYRYITSAQQQYIEAANDSEHTITLKELVGDPSTSGANQYWFVDGLEKFENDTLAVEGEESDHRTLIINVDCEGRTSWNFDTCWWGVPTTYGSIQIPANELATTYVEGYTPTGNWEEDSANLKYDLIIFNFEGLVNVEISQNPQNLVNSVMGSYINRYWNDLSYAQQMERTAVCSNIIYSFPDAENIEHKSGFFSGSIIAPNADYYGTGGSLNGQLVADNYTTTGGNEIHALSLNRKAMTIVESPEPEGKIQLYKYLKYDGEKENTRLSGTEFILWREQTDGSIEYYVDGTFTSNRDDALENLYIPTADIRVEITGLPYGIYYLEETKPPTGYERNTSDESDLDTYYLTEVEVTEEEKTKVVSKYNEPYSWDWTFQKVDAKDHTIALEGAKFRIVRLGDEFYENDRQLEATYVSDGNGYFSIPKLTVGKYILKEIEAPPGYQPVGSGDYYFRIRNITDEQTGETHVYIYWGHDENGWQDDALVIYTTAGSGSGFDPPPIEIENEVGAPQTALYVYKYEETAGVTDNIQHPLRDAVFQLWRQESDGTWIQIKDNTKDYHGEYGADDSSHPGYQDMERITTSESGYAYIPFIAPGTYRLVEIEAPEGYLLSNTEEDQSGDFEPEEYIREFEVEAPDPALSDTTSVTLAEVPNKQILTDLVLEKYGEYAGDISLIDTASFRVDRKNPLTGEYTEELFTQEMSYTKDGKMYLTNLSAGDYRIIEREAPDGYTGLNGDFQGQLTDYIYFTLAYEDDVLKLTNLEVDFANRAKLDFDDLEKDEMPSADRPVSYAVNYDTGSITIRIFNEAQTANLLILKRDSEVFQEGLDSDEYKLIVNYLEGARFRLLHYNGTDWAAYGDEFTSEKTGGLDEFGNEICAAECTAPLVIGNYRIVEMETPEGYLIQSDYGSHTFRDGETGQIVRSFSVTSAMEGGIQEFTIDNFREVARGDLTVNKVDSQDQAIEGVPFRLWRITGGGSEDWDATVSLEDALDAWESLTFEKYYIEDGLMTDSDGYITLENVAPGLYVLFEMWNDSFQENDPDFLRDYLYFLSHQSTVLSDTNVDVEFYYHLTAFRVVAVDEDDIDAGIRIQWVHQSKIWNGEAEFDNKTHNVDNWTWTDEMENSHLAFTIRNKRRDDLPVDVSLGKVDEEGEPLEGAEFTLYRRTVFGNDPPQESDYEEVDAVLSSSEGIVTFEGLDAVWRWNVSSGGFRPGDPADHSDDPADPQNYRSDSDISMWSEYMIKETDAPSGYVLLEEPIYFMLWANPLSKALDLIELDYSADSLKFPESYPDYTDLSAEIAQMERLFGSTPLSLSHSTFPNLSWWRQNYSDPDENEEGYPYIDGTFTEVFELGKVSNRPEAVDFKLIKVAMEDQDKTLRGAEFTLYSCLHADDDGHEHSDLTAADGSSCWDVDHPVAVVTADLNGIVLFSGIALGVYQMVETKAPTGYELPRGQWQIKVNTDGTVAFEGSETYIPPAVKTDTDENGKPVYLVTNKRSYELPAMGGSGIWRFGIIGLLLLLMSGVLYYFYRRHDKSNEMSLKKSKLRRRKCAAVRRI